MKTLLIALSIITQLETNNKDLCAVGDNGKAFGYLQIHKEVIIDVNRIYECSYEHKDAFNEQKSYDIAIMYLSYWSEHYTKKTGKQPTVETYLRIWNGGAYGWRKKTTDKYLNRLK